MAGGSEMEELMDQLGTGRWNILHYIMVVFASGIPVCHAFASAFLSPRLDHECRPPPSLPNATATGESCSYLEEVGGVDVERTCQHWSFDNSTFHTTVTAEYELVCGREYLRSLYQSMYMVGVFAGAPVIGPLADRFGRRPLVIAGSLFFSAMAIGSVWIQNFSVLLTSRFFVGLGHTALLKTAYIMALEMSESRVRGTMSPWMASGWSLMTMVLGGMAYLVRDWRDLQLYMSLIGLLHILGFWFLDESPRWLAVVGRHEEALKVLRRAASLNKVELPPEDAIRAVLKAEREKAVAAQGAQGQTVAEVVKEKFKEVFILFRTPRLRFLTCISYFAHLVVAMVYFGISLLGANLGTDPFVYIELMGVTELVAFLYLPLLLNRIGRRGSGVLHFLMSGVVSLGIPFVPQSLHWLKMVLAVVAKMAIIASFSCVTLLFTESFPTEVRSRGMSTSFMMSRVGAMIVPFINDMLGSVVLWAPTVVFGVTSVAVGLSLLTVKEPLGRALPETIQEMENDAKEDGGLKAKTPPPPVTDTQI